ncbi:MAG: lipopolysaccharide biosynthesis protein RfbH, partial [Synergistaceae bacterium]|nr:lipopolysaccharide biosynthesis protein RfbH [Synergistaceae bacterium]
MFEDLNENEARVKVLELVKEYHDRYRAQKINKNFIPYAGRVYDAQEMLNLIDASLDFWLTAGKW